MIAATEPMSGTRRARPISSGNKYSAPHAKAVAHSIKPMKIEDRACTRASLRRWRSWSLLTLGRPGGYDDEGRSQEAHIFAVITAMRKNRLLEWTRQISRGGEASRGSFTGWIGAWNG